MMGMFSGSPILLFRVQFLITRSGMQPGMGMMGGGMPGMMGMGMMPGSMMLGMGMMAQMMAANQALVALVGGQSLSLPLVIIFFFRMLAKQQLQCLLTQMAPLER